MQLQVWHQGKGMDSVNYMQVYAEEKKMNPPDSYPDRNRSMLCVDF